MNKQKTSYEEKVERIISVCKVFLMIFSSVVCMQAFNPSVIENHKNYYFVLKELYILAFILIGILISMKIAANFFKTFFDTNRIKIIYVENIILMGIFSILIFNAGYYNYSYRCLFLILIMTTTLEFGLIHGMINSALATLAIFSLDLLLKNSDFIKIAYQNDILLIIMFVVMVWLIGNFVNLKNEKILKIQGLADEDGLTGVYNHRYFYEKIRELMGDFQSTLNEISMIFIDIDYFKYYNDLYGHQQGDKVLRNIAQILKESIRNGDIVARYGGEEFAVILPNTGEEKALEVAEYLRRIVEITKFEGEENQPNGRITVSVGVSTFPGKSSNEVELIKSADDALYKAKFFNKNRVVTYTSILDELKKDIDEKYIDIVTSIKTLISVINAKDKYTYGHVERVVIYSKLLCKKLNLNEEDEKSLIYGAYMHDIGKIDIAKDILNKKMPLDDGEWDLMKQHPVNGVEIITPVESLKHVAPLIKHHHERFDGKGYPDKLKGEEIPFLARVLTVADSFDAMTSNRPYNEKMTYEKGVEELLRNSGTQFDPYVANMFIEVIEENNFSFDNMVASNGV